MKIEQKSKGKNLLDLFENGLSYKVPNYQRSYKWNQNEIEELLNDIIFNNDLNKKMFLGVITLKKSYQEDNILVDGQQRITSFIIIFKAILDYSLENFDDNEGIDDFKNTFQKYIFKSKNSGSKISNRLKLSNIENEDFLESLITFKNWTSIDYKKWRINNNDLFRKNYIAVRNFLYDYEFEGKVNELKQKNINILEYLGNLFKNIWISEIMLNDEDDELQIFESINSKGINLSTFDLIKNYIFIIMKKLNSDEKFQNEVKDFFDQELSKSFLKENKLIEFLRGFVIYLQSILFRKKNINPKLPTKKEKDLYLKFKVSCEKLFNNFQNVSDLKELISLLKKSLNLYKYLDKINSNSNTKFNSDFWVTVKIMNSFLLGNQFFPLLIQLSDNLIEFDNEDRVHEISEEFKKCVSFLEKYIIRRESIGEGTRLITRTINKLIIDSFDDLKSVLRDTYPTNESFADSLGKSINHMGNSPKKALLWKIELYINSETNETIKLNDFSNFSIEHILPQKISNEAEKNQIWWQNYLGKNEFRNIHARSLEKLGNLTLTKDNSKISNKEWDKKVEHYQKSQLLLNKKIARYESWKEDDIKKRNKFLKEIAMKIWGD